MHPERLGTELSIGQGMVSGWFTNGNPWNESFCAINLAFGSKSDVRSRGAKLRVGGGVLHRTTRCSAWHPMATSSDEGVAATTDCIESLRVQQFSYSSQEKAFGVLKSFGSRAVTPLDAGVV